MQAFMEKEKKAGREKPDGGSGRTGIPVQLKRRVEKNTGVSLDDVQVHYDSREPSKLDALAYTQGNQVYIGPGQQRHLPHELGHVVQQKLGMVRPNERHYSGVDMNTDQAMEAQADRIGAGQESIGGGEAE